MDFSNLPEHIVKTILYLKNKKNIFIDTHTLWSEFNFDVDFYRYEIDILNLENIFDISIITNSSKFKFEINLNDNIYKQLIRQDKLNRINKD